MFGRAVATLLMVTVSTAPVPSESSSPPVTTLETAYAALADAYYVTSTIDSGLFKTYQGKDRAAWNQIYQARRKEVSTGLTKISSENLSSTDARVVSFIRKELDYYESSGDSFQPHGRCQDAEQQKTEASKLRDALYSCFDELGNNVEFEGKCLTRVGALHLLSTLEGEERRKALFLALEPLWTAINHHDESQSPYRRVLKTAAAKAAKEGYSFEAAARTLGVKPSEVEQKWLEQILDAWRQISGDQMLEPWDYLYVNGQANRILDSAISRDSLLPITERYYRDLGADLKELKVLYDLDPRPGKAPLAYMNFVTLGRQEDRSWRPTVVRISANYSNGGLSELNEFVHENGHAVHGLALRTRPVFMDLGDSLFVEAFADVTSWDVYDSKWQQKYLGHAVPDSVSLRCLYSSVVLDSAWALFEIRLLQKPDADPNVIWTDITSHYLHIVPHPEWSWWALRVQLVDPGYMVNYGLGAVLTADLRQHTVESIGPFHTGNPRWYPWLSANLLRFGNEQDTSDLLQNFLGRKVSPRVLVEDIARARP